MDPTGEPEWITGARTVSELEHVWREWVKRRREASLWRPSALPFWCKTCSDLFTEDKAKTVGNIIHRNDQQYALYMRDGDITMEDFESQLQHHPLVKGNTMEFNSNKQMTAGHHHSVWNVRFQCHGGIGRRVLAGPTQHKEKRDQAVPAGGQHVASIEASPKKPQPTLPAEGPQSQILGAMCEPAPQVTERSMAVPAKGQPVVSKASLPSPDVPHPPPPELSPLISQLQLAEASKAVPTGGQPVASKEASP